MWKLRLACTRQGESPARTLRRKPHFATVTVQSGYGSGTRRRDGRAAQGARLESVFTERCRGFESHSLRQSASLLSTFSPSYVLTVGLLTYAFPYLALGFGRTMANRAYAVRDVWHSARLARTPLRCPRTPASRRPKMIELVSINGAATSAALRPSAHANVTLPPPFPAPELISKIKRCVFAS